MCRITDRNTFFVDPITKAKHVFVAMKLLSSTTHKVIWSTIRQCFSICCFITILLIDPIVREPTAPSKMTDDDVWR